MPPKGFLPPLLPPPERSFLVISIFTERPSKSGWLEAKASKVFSSKFLSISKKEKVSKISIDPISTLSPIFWSLIKPINVPGFKLSFLPMLMKKRVMFSFSVLALELSLEDKSFKSLEFS